jgi:ankyrin repeat protein
VRLLLERGADPASANRLGMTPLMKASSDGHLEVVRVLLGHPSGKSTINHLGHNRVTALWLACYQGRGGGVRRRMTTDDRDDDRDDDGDDGR